LTKREEIEHKLDTVRQWLGDQRHGGLLLRQRTNFAWITAGGRSHINTARDGGAGALLITPERFVLVASNIEARRLMEEELSAAPVEVAEYPWHDGDGERQLLDKLMRDHAGLCIDNEPAIGSAVAQMRTSLLESEVCRLEELGRITGQIVEEVCRQLRPGHSEYEVAAYIHAAALPHGARVPVCLVAGDDRIVERRHPLPTGRLISTRAMVAVCIERTGLICSATRLVSFVPLTDELRRRHDAVCSVDAVAVNATRVGRPLCNIFAEIVEAYARAGFPEEWREHHQGGSTGYQPRETIASPASGAVVRINQPFAWNPSIAGTKSEDTMLATAEGFRWITAPGLDWPSLSVEINGRAVRRPDILLTT
jgi:Xaa-Pro aminopeptidase